MLRGWLEDEQLFKEADRYARAGKAVGMMPIVGSGCRTM